MNVTKIQKWIDEGLTYRVSSAIVCSALQTEDGYTITTFDGWGNHTESFETVEELAVVMRKIANLRKWCKLVHPE